MINTSIRPLPIRYSVLQMHLGSYSSHCLGLRLDHRVQKKPIAFRQKRGDAFETYECANSNGKHSSDTFVCSLCGRGNQEHIWGDSNRDRLSQWRKRQADMGEQSFQADGVAGYKSERLVSHSSTPRAPSWLYTSVQIDCLVRFVSLTAYQQSR
jgi:hypothetical protein